MTDKIILLFLLLSTVPALGQGSSSEIIPLAETDQQPKITGCQEDFLSCISMMFNEKFPEKVIEDSGITKPAGFIFKFIIDTKGEIRWINAIGDFPGIKEEGIRLIKALPAFEPGSKNGRKVNVMVDFPISFKPVAKSPAVASKPYDIPPYPPECKGSEDLKKCMASYMQEYIFDNLDTNFDREEGWDKIDITFDIDINGKVQNIRTTGKNEEFKTEAVKIIRDLPNFIPAIKSGKAVKSTYSLPILIRTDS